MKKIMVILYTLCLSGMIHTMDQVKSAANAQQNQRTDNQPTIIPSKENNPLEQPRTHNDAVHNLRPKVIQLRDLMRKNSKL